MTHLSRSASFERQVQPGHFLYWQGQRFRLLPGDLSEPLLIHVEDIVTLEQHIVRVEELLLPEDSGLPEPLFAPTLAALQGEIERRHPPADPINTTGLPAHLLHRADTIVAVVDTVDKLVVAEEGRALLRQEKFQRTPAIRRACAQLAEPVQLATYYKYRHLYREWGGDRDRIAAALRRSTFNQTGMDKAQLHFVDTHILRFYARSRSLRPRPLTLYRIVQSAFERTNGLWLDPEQGTARVPENVVEELLNPKLPMQAILDNPEKSRLLRPIALPSRSWFYQYLRWFEHQPEQGKEVMIARHGQEMWERELLLFDTFVARATLPLQYVFADHWLVDVFTVDEATRSRLDRLWLTLLIDAYSRSVLGLALLYEAPCLESIQSALRHAIWPKTSHQELEIEGEWLCYGIPQQLSLDNAWAHHAFSLENLARVIGQGGRYSSIDLVFRPPYKGRYGALIERFFGNLSGQVKELLPGAIRSGDARSLHQAAKDACLLYQDIYRLIHQMIVAYQHTPHHELGGLTPSQKWVAGMQFGHPLVPPLTPALERLFWRMSPETRVISGKGVCAFGLHYSSPELSGAQRVGLDGRSVRYNYSYEPADISRIALFCHEQWIGDLYARELRLPDGSTMPLSLWEQKMAKALAHSDGQSARDWLTYVHEIDELAKSRLAERKKALRQATRSDASTRGARPGGEVQAMETAMEQTRSADPRNDYTDLLAAFVEHEAAWPIEPTGQEKSR
jgi:hypothetical protein